MTVVRFLENKTFRFRVASDEIRRSPVSRRILETHDDPAGQAMSWKPVASKLASLAACEVGRTKLPDKNGPLRYLDRVHKLPANEQYQIALRY